MDGILSQQAIEWLMLVAALVTAMAIFALLWRILRVALGLVIPAVILALILQFVFDVSPTELLREGMQFLQGLWYRLGV